MREKQARIEAHFGPGRDLRTISAGDFTDYARKAAEDGRKPATVLRELRELAIGMRKLGFASPPMPDLGRVNTPRERWLTPEETRKLLPHLPASRREHVLAYRLLGVRKSELFRICAKDLEPGATDVRVRGTKSDDADRWIPVHPELRPILLRRAAETPHQLFPDWQRGNADRDLRAAAEAAGLGPLSFNDLRRSFAMELLRKGVPAREVAELLGHTSTRMVEEHYARLRPGKHLDRAVAMLDGGYETLQPPRTNKIPVSSRELRAERDSGASLAAIARKYGVTRQAIQSRLQTLAKQEQAEDGETTEVYVRTEVSEPPLH